MSDLLNKLSIGKMSGSSLFSSTALEAIQKQQNQLTKLLEPFGIAIIKQNDQFRSIFHSSVFESLKKQQKLLMSPAIEAIQSEQIRIDNLLRSSIFDSMFKEEKALSRLLSSSIHNSIRIAPSILSDLSKINSFAESLRQASKYPDILKSIEESFSLSLLQKLKNEDITLDDTIQIVEESFSKKLECTPHSLISFEGMVQLFIAFMLFIYAQTLSLESEENIIKRMEQFESHMIEQLVQLVPNDEPAVFYIVKRTVNLRASNSTKSSIISLLYPNQRVELIERNSKWIYVKYFDYIDGVPKMGWVYKKYLRMEK